MGHAPKGSGQALHRLRLLQCVEKRRHLAEDLGHVTPTSSHGSRSGTGTAEGGHRSQTVKGSEAGGARGYDGGKKINGRKRHIIVDTMGLLLVVLVTSANIDDGTGAPEVLKLLSEEHKSRLDEIRGDNKYNNRTLDQYVERSKAQYKITVVERPAGVHGLVHLPYRWVVERTNAWNGKYRRNSKDYERTTSSSEAMIKVSTIHLMLNRLRPDTDTNVAKFTYTPNPMKKAA